MNKRHAAMWQRAFERAFLDYRAAGYTEDQAIDLAERAADIGLDRYCDDEWEEHRYEYSYS
jgi:hypothetical protein